jgi:hypothetical protein
MMEAASTSGTSVNFYQSTRRSNPEDSHLDTGRRVNISSYKIQSYILTVTADGTYIQGYSAL